MSTIVSHNVGTYDMMCTIVSGTKYISLPVHFYIDTLVQFYRGQFVVTRVQLIIVLWCLSVPEYKIVCDCHWPANQFPRWIEHLSRRYFSRLFSVNILI